jgi:hypothetical protein
VARGSSEASVLADKFDDSTAALILGDVAGVDSGGTDEAVGAVDSLIFILVLGGPSYNQRLVVDLFCANCEVLDCSYVCGLHINAIYLLEDQAPNCEDSSQDIEKQACSC